MDHFTFYGYGYRYNYGVRLDIIDCCTGHAKCCDNLTAWITVKRLTFVDRSVRQQQTINIFSVDVGTAYKIVSNPLAGTWLIQVNHKNVMKQTLKRFCDCVRFSFIFCTTLHISRVVCFIRHVAIAIIYSRTTNDVFSYYPNKPEIFLSSFKYDG